MFRKQPFPALMAVGAVLSAAVAAPYLIPADPDSTVMRVSMWCAALLLACFVPLKAAYEEADRRTLICSGVFGLLLAGALSLGTELTVYDGLLRGMGSLIRRLAVPVLAAPMLGGLTACALTRKKKASGVRVGAFGPALLIFLMWLPVLAAYYPGMLNYDLYTELGQTLSGEYSAIHPLLHSALLTVFIRLGDMLGSRTLGILCLSLCQMACFAGALGRTCAFAGRRGVPKWGVVSLTLLFGLHPVFSAMAVSMTKDTLFVSGLIVLTLLTAERIFGEEKRSVPETILFSVSFVCTLMMRNNGVFALVPLLLAALPMIREKKRFAAMCAVSALAAGLLQGGLTLALKPAKLPSFQLYSIPAQQLVRAREKGCLTKAESEALEDWYTDEEGLKVHPHLADFAKGYLDRERLAEDGGSFLSLWKNAAGHSRSAYLEAFLMLNIGSWYPDDLSHATIYPDATYSDKGYLQTQEYDLTSFGIENRCFLPKLKALYERICRSNRHQRWPGLSILFGTATPFWLLMLAVCGMVAKRDLRLLPAALGLLGLWLGYLFGPCTLPRYTLPLFCLAPVLLASSLYAGKEAP